MSDYVIEMLNITKEFPGIMANDDITLQLRKGEIHALLGENGAGKSTLMSVLFGLYQPEQGHILKKRRRGAASTIPTTPMPCISAWSTSISSWCEMFTVLENIILGAETDPLRRAEKGRGAREGGGTLPALRPQG